MYCAGPELRLLRLVRRRTPWPPLVVDMKTPSRGREARTSRIGRRDRRLANTAPVREQERAAARDLAPRGRRSHHALVRARSRAGPAVLVGTCCHSPARDRRRRRGAVRRRTQAAPQRRRSGPISSRAHDDRSGTPARAAAAGQNGQNAGTVGPIAVNVAVGDATRTRARPRARPCRSTRARRTRSPSVSARPKACRSAAATTTNTASSASGRTRTPRMIHRKSLAFAIFSAPLASVRRFSPEFAGRGLANTKRYRAAAAPMLAPPSDRLSWDARLQSRRRSAGRRPLDAAAVACLHIPAGARSAAASAWRRRIYRPTAAVAESMRRRVRYLHHHLPGAGGVHFPAAAQRARPAHRPRAAALRSVFRRATARPATRRQGRGAAGPRSGHARRSRPSRSSRSIAGRASPSPARRLPPVSTPSRARTRASMPSTS